MAVVSPSHRSNYIKKHYDYNKVFITSDMKNINEHLMKIKAFLKCDHNCYFLRGTLVNAIPLFKVKSQSHIQHSK